MAARVFCISLLPSADCADFCRLNKSGVPNPRFAAQCRAAVDSELACSNGWVSLCIHKAAFVKVARMHMWIYPFTCSHHLCWSAELESWETAGISYVNMDKFHIQNTSPVRGPWCRMHIEGGPFLSCLQRLYVHAVTVLSRVGKIAGFSIYRNVDEKGAFVYAVPPFPNLCLVFMQIKSFWNL